MVLGEHLQRLPRRCADLVVIVGERVYERLEAPYRSPFAARSNSGTIARTQPRSPMTSAAATRPISAPTLSTRWPDSKTSYSASRRRGGSIVELRPGWPVA